MMYVKRYYLFIFFFIFLQTSLFSTEKSINVLVLDSYHQSQPWTKSFLKGLEKAKLNYNFKINYYIEYMDSSRIQNPLNDSKWISYLMQKYNKIDFDIIVADSDYSSNILKRNNHHFKETIPLIYYINSPIECSTNEKMITPDIVVSTTKTVEIALKQNPAAKKIVLIHGIKFDSNLLLSVLKNITNENPDLKLEIITSKSIENMMEQVKNIPPDTIIFYSLVIWDEQGKNYIPRNILSQITENSQAPVYTFWSSLLESGTVGGHMIDAETIAIQMVAAGIDYISSNKFNGEYICSQTFFDWNAVKKYKINKSTISQEAKIINMPLPFWKVYFNQLLGLAAILTFILLIISYFWSRKLHKINKKLSLLNTEVILAKEKAEKEARTDNLTGLNNRLAFFEKGEQICREIRRLKKPVSLLMLDIDDFKHINDSFGHPQGDRVIKKLAEIINITKREIDIGVRFGGEEFVVVVPFSDQKGATLLAERIRKKVGKSVIKYGSNKIKFTVSIGVFSTVPTDCNLNRALKNADDEMYKAKSLGKNRVCVFNKK